MQSDREKADLYVRVRECYYMAKEDRPREFRARNNGRKLDLKSPQNRPLKDRKKRRRKAISAREIRMLKSAFSTWNK